MKQYNVYAKEGNSYRFIGVEMLTLKVLQSLHTVAILLQTFKLESYLHGIVIAKKALTVNLLKLFMLKLATLRILLCENFIG